MKKTWATPFQINSEIGHDIMVKETEIIIHKMKKGKAASPDNREAEFLKLHYEGEKWLTMILNKLYNSGIIPQD